MGITTKQRVYDYASYREFLADWVKEQDSEGRGQILKIANHIHVHNSFVSKVMKGEKDFSLEQIHALSGFLGLSEHETDYLVNLLSFERAATKPLKDHFEKKLKKSRQQSLEVKHWMKHDRQLSREEQTIYYSKWYYSAIRSLTVMEKFQTPKAIAEALRLPVKTVQQALEFLVSYDLCVKEGTKYKRGPVSTFVPKSSPQVFNHHTNWRLKAIEHYGNFKDDELSFTSPLTISDQDFKKVHKWLLTVIEELSMTVRDSDAESLVCFNVDWFRVID